MNKAAIDIGIKSVDEDKRLIEGWATKPEEDLVGDIVMPKGAVYELPLPFLLDHDHSKSVGLVDKVEVTDKGIKFWAHIKRFDEDGEAKRLTDYAWQLVKTGLRAAVSIGFKGLDVEQIPNSYGVKFKKWRWLELSAVTVPALPSARILATKNFDESFVTVPVSRVRNGGIALIAPKSEKQTKRTDGAVPLK